VAGLTSSQAVEKLRQRGIVGSVTPYATQYARLAAGVFNTPEEIDRTLARVRELSA
jgi:isopenicillin-N epimerase